MFSIFTLQYSIFHRIKLEALGRNHTCTRSEVTYEQMKRYILTDVTGVTLVTYRVLCCCICDGLGFSGKIEISEQYQTNIEDL